MLPIMPTRTLKKDDLLALVYGACFLGSGGGGPISMAHTFLEKIPANALINLVPAFQLGDNKKALVVVDVGSPEKAQQEKLGFTAPLNAYNAMSKSLNSPINYLLPGELGAVNSLIPFYLAAINNQIEGVIDADMCGRAAPRLSETLLNAVNVPCCPAVIASDTDSNGAYQTDTFYRLTPTGLEYAARSTVMKPGYNQVGGVAFYPLETNFIKSPKAQNALAYHSISTAIEIGKLLLKPVTANDMVPLLNTLLNNLQIENRLLVRGQIKAITGPQSQGFDFKKIIINNGLEEFWLYVKNESLLAWDTQKLSCRAIAPDCINLLKIVNNQVTPASTAEVAVNDDVIVWLSACPEQVRSNNLIEQFNEDIASILAAFPEDGIRIPNYQPLTSLNT